MLKKLIILIATLSIVSFMSNLASSEENLNLTIKIDEEIYEVGDEINIELIWENNGEGSLYLLPWRRNHTTDWIKIEDNRGNSMSDIKLVIYELKPAPAKDDYILLKSKKDRPFNRHIEHIKGVIKKEELKHYGRGELIEGIFMDFEDSAILLKGSGWYEIYAEYTNDYNYYRTNFLEGSSSDVPIDAWTGKIKSNLITFSLVDNRKIIEVKKEVSNIEAIEIANKKAEELEYKVNEMSISVTKAGKDKFWKVYYGPLKLQKGGDLTIYVDARDGAIRDIIRGE